MTAKLIVYIAGLTAALSLCLMTVPASVQAAPSLVMRPAGVVASTAGAQFEKSWAWYVTRASGVLAAILLALLVASGVGLLTGTTYRILEPLPAWAAHRALGLSFGVMVLIHVVVLLFDKFVGLGLADVLVPFYSAYNTISIAGHQVSLYMSLGVLALYLVMLIIITSLLWMQKRPKPWRLVHYLSYAVLILVFVHGVFLGTDLKHGWIRLLWIIAGVGILVAILPRLRRAGTLHADKIELTGTKTKEMDGGTGEPRESS